MTESREVYALVLAGGVGTRLWPCSRRNHPKQLMALIDDRSLLQMTVDRIRPMIPPERVFIMTNARYVDTIREQVPAVPPENIIGEPAVRGTAPAIGLGAFRIRHSNPDSLMVALHADHYFSDEEQFRRALQAAIGVAADGWLVNLGVRPTYPATGYGYVELGKELGTFHGHPSYEVVQFKEKPDIETARQFVASGRYLWNSGIFCWRIDVILDAFGRFLPDHTAVLARIAEAFGSPQATEVLHRGWQRLEGETSIDHGIMERANQVATVPMSAGWDDVGSWDSVAGLLLGDDDGDATVIRGDAVAFDSRHVFAQSDTRFVALVGVDDLIVVDTQDALLICSRDRAQDVKQVVNWLAAAGRDELL